MSEALEDVVQTEVESLGYDLVEVRRHGTRGRPVLDVRIDRRDGSAVTVDDCARVSRAVEARFDAAPSLAGDRYILEVSSPGVERRLRNAGDWRRFAGQDASVSLNEPGGRVTGRIVGVEVEEGRQVAVLRDAGGGEIRVPLAGVREARLVFNWKR